MNVIETSGLGKRYGDAWALRECTLAIPAGHLAALVGPNGAGKTTLMNMTAGLAVPTAGTVAVLGGQPAGSPAALDGIAFVAQDAPVYGNLSGADMLHLTANLNRSFDREFARARLAELGIGLKKKCGKLSGGQQAQLALTLALARRPRLLILDEPLSALDPLARQDFLATVMTAMADDGVSVLLSSHALAELFGTRGLVFAAWTLVAFAFGAFLGMLFRRIIPAMAVTLGVYIGLALLTWSFLRKYYVPSVVTSSPAFESGPITPQDPWVLSHWFVGSTRWTRYIPVSRFWPMQFIEAGWLLVLSVLLVAATVWLVRRRAA
jgi:ABC-type Mn2+/Zn2+ transport system ATPase subunit